MQKVKPVTRKAFIIRPSGRSTDFISPSFGHGCLYNCSYCYMKRHKPHGLTVATNTGDILTEINNHAYFTPVDKPNQTHAKYTTYDISCNEDFALHAKYHEWKKIFDFFRDHPVAMGSFATKYVNKHLLDYDPKGKIRIRFSLMPERMANIHEHHTSRIIERITAINDFIDAGYDVHINYSPVIVYDGWLDDYARLFDLVDQHVRWKEQVLAEVIFLTHNVNKHIVNLNERPDVEDTLWSPDIQETKISQYGGENIRYKHDLKREFIEEFIELHESKIPWNTIRYIF
tara:strand:- start:15582 stop:16442 length:861 start_codon:yes stop_codon:yes gene_type:complete